jgi:hypothetical protein
MGQIGAFTDLEMILTALSSPLSKGETRFLRHKIWKCPYLPPSKWVAGGPLLGLPRLPSLNPRPENYRASARLMRIVGLSTGD